MNVNVARRCQMTGYQTTVIIHDQSYGLTSCTANTLAILEFIVSGFVAIAECFFFIREYRSLLMFWYCSEGSVCYLGIYIQTYLVHKLFFLLVGMLFAHRH